MKTNNLIKSFLEFHKAVVLVLLLLSYLSQSCDNYVDVDLPNSQLTSTTVFEDIATANAAMIGVYAKMRTTGLFAGTLTGGSTYLGLYADELDFYSTNVNNFYNNTLIASESGVATMWNQSYHQIYEANAIIEGVSNSTNLSTDDRNQLKGEALFVRSFIHLYLVNLFGDIPYVATTNFEQNTVVARMPKATVYQNIIADLELAKTLLPEAYTSIERIRPNRWAAAAIQARAYLYSGAFAEASNTASSVINSSLYVWENDLDKIFLKGSPTTIWQFSPNAAGNNTSEGNLYIFPAGPPSSVALKNNFVNAFEINDQRKIKWLKAVTNGSTTWYHAFKYKQRNPTASSMEYSIVLRLAEQYLIRAEARARQGELTNAKSDLNLIRNTAGLPNTLAVTAEQIVTDVLNQRRFELFTEFGHRFFDLKRSNQLDVVLPATKPGWNYNDQLWPIPALELSANPNLNPQNPDY